MRVSKAVRTIAACVIALASAGAAVTKAQTPKPAVVLKTAIIKMQNTKPFGHNFVVDATIGSESIKFLVDTAAVVTAVSQVTAKKLGLTTPIETMKIETATGVITEVPIYLISEVTVGQVTVRDVHVAVTPQGNTNLLGMSFLAKLKSFMYKDGVLVLVE